jgi:hypothetical protein
MTTLKRRKIGKTNLEVTELGLKREKLLDANASTPN